MKNRLNLAINAGIILAAIGLILYFLFGGTSRKLKPGERRALTGLSILPVARGEDLPPSGVGAPIVMRRQSWTGDYHAGHATYQSLLPIEPTWSDDSAYFSHLASPDNQLDLGLHYGDNGQADLLVLHVPVGYNFTFNDTGIINALKPPDIAEFLAWQAENPNANFALTQNTLDGKWFGRIVSGTFTPVTEVIASLQDLSGLHCLIETGQTNFIQIEADWSGVTTPPPGRSEPPPEVTIYLYAVPDNSSPTSP